MTPTAALAKQKKLLRRVQRYAALAKNEPLMRAALEGSRLNYLRSTAAKAATLARAGFRTQSATRDLFDRAARMDALHPPPLIVPWRFKERRSGTLRIVCDLPAQLRLSHLMARHLLIAQCNPKPHIFAWPARGRDRAVSALQAAFLEGHHFYLSADIQRCFESVDFDAIYNLDLLPVELIRNALDYRRLKFRRYGQMPVRRNGNPYGPEEVERTGPRGLLEGSAASDALFGVLLDDLPNHLSRDVRLFVYGDNIVVAARQADEISRAEEALVRYLAEHPAGPFFLKSARGTSRAGLEFLGYELWCSAEGEVRVDQSTPHWCNAMRRFEAQAGGADPATLVEGALQGFPAVSAEYRSGLLSIAEDYVGWASPTAVNAELATSAGLRLAWAISFTPTS